jgi:hypothetical protein
MDCNGDCFGSAVIDECGVCGGDGSSCADCAESSVTATVDESALENMDAFEDNFEALIETALDLPDGTVEVINVTVISRSIEIEVDFTITLTEEELANTNFESTDDIADALVDVEEGIEEEGGMSFVEGCTDPDYCNYNPLATIDDGSCLAEDCAGECGGSSEVDACGDCNGNNPVYCLDDGATCGYDDMCLSHASDKHISS